MDFSELFSLPIAALWTAVLGDWDREIEEFTEQRIPIDLIAIHEEFQNYQHDIGILKVFIIDFKLTTLN